MTPRSGETAEHIKLASFLDAVGAHWCHVPNGGSRNVVEATKLKRMGVKPGVPDILIFDRPPLQPEACGIAIELKAIRGKLREAQTFWLNGLRERGWLAYVCYSAQEAKELLLKKLQMYRYKRCPGAYL